MDEVEAHYIRRVLESVGWKKTKAARVLGFDRSTLYRKLERYSLDGPEEGAPNRSQRYATCQSSLT
jgi:DNA-binding NtrC family response regulator